MGGKRIAELVVALGFIGADFSGCGTCDRPARPPAAKVVIFTARGCPEGCAACGDDHDYTCTCAGPGVCASGCQIELTCTINVATDCHHDFALPVETGGAGGNVGIWRASTGGHPWTDATTHLGGRDAALDARDASKDGG